MMWSGIRPIKEALNILCVWDLNELVYSNSAAADTSEQTKVIIFYESSQHICLKHIRLFVNLIGQSLFEQYSVVKAMILQWLFYISTSTLLF